MGTVKHARSTGILISHTLSKEGLAYIEKHDPDLHYAILQRLTKRKGGKSK